MMKKPDDAAMQRAADAAELAALDDKHAAERAERIARALAKGQPAPSREPVTVPETPDSIKKSEPPAKKEPTP